MASSTHPRDGDVDCRVRDGGRLWIVPAQASVVAALGLETVADGLDLPGRVLRDLSDRRNVLVEPVEPGGARYYLKVLKERPARLGFGWGGSDRRFDRALGEFRLLERFRRAGLPVPSPVAAGADPTRGSSFVLTEEVPDATPLDDWLEGVDPSRDRGEILASLGTLARMARRMHDADLFHRDYYLCHVLRSKDEVGSLTLLDVERALVRPRRRGRWIIKDLAALASSTPPMISRADRWRFLRLYLGERTPSRGARRRLVGRILRKETRIRRHVPHKARDPLRGGS